MSNAFTFRKVLSVRRCFCVWLTLCSPTYTTAELTAFPDDTLATLGQTVQLTCGSSKEEPVEWSYVRASDGVDKGIVRGYWVMNKEFRDRFNVSKTLYDQQDLVIRNVSYQDAGKYTCAEEGGLGNRSSAQLVVIDDCLFCTSNATADIVRSDGCITGDINVTCSLTLNAMLTPVLQWKHRDDEWNVTGTMTKRNDVSSRAAYSVILSGDKTWREEDVACSVGLGDGDRFEVIRVVWESPLMQPDCRRESIQNDTENNRGSAGRELWIALGSILGCMVFAFLFRKKLMRYMRTGWMLLSSTQASSNRNFFTINNKVFECRLISTLPSLEGAVYGVDCLEGVIYVLRKDNPEILLFDARTFKRMKATVTLHALETHDILRPLNIVASQTERCLFISDRDKEHYFTIWRLTTARKVNRWLHLPDQSEENYSCSKLSVMTRRNASDLVITMQKCGSERRLDIYGNNIDQAVLMFSFDLLANRGALGDMLVFAHAVQARMGGDFIFCEGWDLKPDQPHLVHKWSRDDGYIWTYGKRSDPEKFCGPAHLACDSRGNVFVADYRNRRLCILNSSGKECRVLKEWENDNPVRLLVQEKNDNITWLFVGLYNSKSVEIYAIKPGPRSQQTRASMRPLMGESYDNYVSNTWNGDVLSVNCQK